ncbi:MAG: hypothetical protein AAGF02_08000 [Actinomycetota bacterium]
MRSAAPIVRCGLCASLRAGDGQGPAVPVGEAHTRLAAARQRVDTLDLGHLAGLPNPAYPAPELLGERDDVRGAVLAQAYAVMGRPANGRLPEKTARGIEAGAGLVAASVAGLYVPPWVGGGGRIVINTPVIAKLMAREDLADRDALASLVVAHERVHHVQHTLRTWQDVFLGVIDEVLAADRRTQRRIAGRAQAIMSVVEGHASYVERLAVMELHDGDDDLWWRIRGRHLDQRLGGLLQGLVGMLFASKRDQYKRGMLFSADAADLVPDAFEIMFGEEDGMPELDELDHADRWRSRQLR